MARGVKTPAKKPAATTAAKKPVAKPATEQVAATAAQPAATTAAIQDNVQQPVQAVAVEQVQAAQAPTVIIKDSTNVNTDVREHVTERIGTASITHDGNAPITELDQIDFQSGVDMVGFKEHADQLAFLEEVLVINIMKTTDKNAENVVFLSVNGEGAGFQGQPYLPRGVDVPVKRKFVEKLLRSRPSSYESQEYLADNGERKIRYPETAALLYPFQVVNDPSPDKHKAWMTQIMAERA